MSSTDFPNAIKKYREILGETGVIIGPQAQLEYGASTLGTDRPILAALLPKNKEHVVEIVKIAREFNTPLYPISRGNNWGYGSANPAIGGCIIVDLSIMQNIVAFDEELGLITVEPGVTVGHLKKFLSERHLPFLSPDIASSSHCSLIGNALEKGWSLSAFTDRASTIRTIEAVLADGTVYRSAHSNTPTKGFYKLGVGPYIDGLFLQNNIGIVTQATLVLAPRPSYAVEFIFSPNIDISLTELADLLRKTARRLGTVVPSMKIHNSRSVFAQSIPYPDKSALEEGLLGEVFVQKTLNSFSLTEWTVVGILQGEQELVHASEKVMKRMLKPFAKHLIFFDAKILTTLSYSRFLPLLGDIKKMIAILPSLISIFKGRPGEGKPRFDPLPFWKLESSKDNKTLVRKENIADYDLDAHCGIIFFAGVLPMKGRTVEEFAVQVKKICHKNQVEPILRFVYHSGEYVICSLPILFDKKNDLAKIKASACYRELYEAILSTGGYVHRIPIDMMQLLIKPDDTYWDTAKKIKAALDPTDIISPGRYSNTNRK